MIPPLARLRAHVVAIGLDGIIVPRADIHQSEVTAPHDDCLRWLTGFTGSAGVAVVLADRALLFVDGRYQVQVRAEVDPAAWEIRHLIEEPPADWLRANAARGSRLGLDATRFSCAALDALTAGAGAAGAGIVELDHDPFDAIWDDRPPAPLGAIRAMPDADAGATSADKRARIGAALAQAGADLLLETLPDNIAWLLNLRGSDVPMNPVPHSFLILDRDGGAEWFVDRRKLGNDPAGLVPGGVVLAEPDSFLARVRAVAPGKVALMDPGFAPAALRAAVIAGGGSVLAQPDPVTLAKAVKTPAELAGFRACHLQDGAAVTDFLAWIAQEVPLREAAGHPVTELEAEAHLHHLRSLRAGFLEDSFRTISAAGANAAMCHYTAPATGGAAIGTALPYLVDSGGQYATGTTDVTRTLCLGAGDDALRDAYTAVLRGFLALLTARFPTGTTPHQLDALARRPLWDIGLDYDHGTGHGVGHNLLIHEYPHRFGKKENPFRLEPGLVLTIEPGFYAEGRFGMRIENQVEVVADRPGFCRFESLTLVPIDLTLARIDRLSNEERTALDTYHAEVRHHLTPLVNARTRDFLAAQTKAVGGVGVQ
ncbi:MAG: aminopeptidase P family protein [Rubellimicrobium sp.]|nr:aminopeptidase P family protein [Rubellimicrobium sp.]